MECEKEDCYTLSLVYMYLFILMVPFGKHLIDIK